MDEQTSEAAVGQAAAEPHGEGTDWKAEARKWEGRAKANKAKADQWDAQEEANKTELEKALARAERLKAELDGVKAEQARAAEVEKAAREHGVSAALLSRMSGDVAEGIGRLNRESQMTASGVELAQTYSGAPRRVWCKFPIRMHFRFELARFPSTHAENRYPDSGRNCDN
jgi:hypothetical protein